MTFLCKARDKRKQKEETGYVNPVRGRLTGSDSIDTLVHVGLAKKSGLRPSARRVVLQDFSACTDEELTARKGDVVYILYRDHDWFYVTTPGGQTGFIPLSFCGRGKFQLPDPPTDRTAKYEPKPSFTSLLQPSYITTASIEQGQCRLPSYQELYGRSCTIKSNIQRTLSDPDYPHDIKPFHKNEQGRSMVLFDFTARNENDLTVGRGEVVQRLNEEDREWIWVRRGDDVEGFVPYTYLCPLGH